MKLKKLLLPVVLLFLCLAGTAQEDQSLANVYFVKSKFYLTPQAKDTLTAFVQKHKNDRHLWIVGRCDKWGGHAYNDWLSVQRANTVTAFLVANGFAKENIDTIRGYGKRRQLAFEGLSEHEVDNLNRVATITGSYAVVQRLLGDTIATPDKFAMTKRTAEIETKAQTPDQFAMTKRRTPIDTTYLSDTVLLYPPYAMELLTTNKYPHKGDVLKTDLTTFVRNDSPFVDKKLYVATADVEPPKPAPVAVAPEPKKDTVAAPPAEIAENTDEDQLGRKVTERLLASKIGESLVIRGINFDFGYHRILKKDKPQLDAVLFAMKQIPTLKLEIQGHICCWPIGQEGFDRDTKEYNLSYNRAKAVFDYLVANGITTDRLTYAGYGMKHPLVYPEKDKDDQYRNRRVEFKITGK